MYARSPRRFDEGCWRIADLQSAQKKVGVLRVRGMPQHIRGADSATRIRFFKREETRCPINRNQYQQKHRAPRPLPALLAPKAIPVAEATARRDIPEAARLAAKVFPEAAEGDNAVKAAVREVPAAAPEVHGAAASGSISERRKSAGSA